jgi:ubiquitin-like-conjugating enzyme ATG10
VLSLDGLLEMPLFNVSKLEYPLNKLDEPKGAIANGEDTHSHFPTISQGEHPETGLPCLYLHPCETSTALQDVLSHSGDLSQGQKDRTTNLQFIEAWAMLVSTLVDIR